MLYFVFTAGRPAYGGSSVAWRSEETARALARARFRQDGHPRLILGVSVGYLALVDGQTAEGRSLMQKNPGTEAARSPGRPKGSKVMTAEAIAEATGMVAGGLSVDEVAKHFGVSSMTVRRYVDVAAVRAASASPDRGRMS